MCFVLGAKLSGLGPSRAPLKRARTGMERAKEPGAVLSELACLFSDSCKKPFVGHQSRYDG